MIMMSPPTSPYMHFMFQKCFFVHRSRTQACGLHASQNKTALWGSIDNNQGPACRPPALTAGNYFCNTLSL